MKFNQAIENIKTSSKKLPLEYREAIKYHGVGPVNIQKLIAMGLVKPKPQFRRKWPVTLYMCNDLFGIFTKRQMIKLIADGDFPELEELFPELAHHYNDRSHNFPAA